MNSARVAGQSRINPEVSVSSAEAVSEANREAQRELYGEPLGETFRRMLATFSLTQAQLAAVLGLSAPMLSQLMAGHRVKIGNPAVLERVRGLEQLSSLESAVPMAPQEIAERLKAVSATTGHLTRPRAQVLPSPGDPVEAVRGVLREVASGRDLRQAAALLQADLPELAEFLVIYGTGSAEQARQHYRDVIEGDGA